MAVDRARGRAASLHFCIRGRANGEDAGAPAPFKPNTRWFWGAKEIEEKILEASGLSLSGGEQGANADPLRRRTLIQKRNDPIPVEKVIHTQQAAHIGASGQEDARAVS